MKFTAVNLGCGDISLPIQAWAETVKGAEDFRGWIWHENIIQHPCFCELWGFWGHSSEDAPRAAAHTADCTAKDENFFLLFLAGEFLSHLQRIFPLWPGRHGWRRWGWAFSSSTPSLRLNRALDQEISTELCKRRELSALVCVCVCVSFLSIILMKSADMERKLRVIYRSERNVRPNCCLVYC